MCDINENNYTDYLNDDWFNSLSTEWVNIFLTKIRSFNTMYEDLFRLKFINITDNNLTSLEPIKYFINLKEINCRNNNLISLDDLEKLNNLEKLNCAHNNLISLKGLNKNIKYLECSYNNLVSLNEVTEYINLIDLNISHNNINSLDNLFNCKNLERLKCIDNYLSNIKGIEYLYKLKELDLSINNLISIDGIEYLINLEYLNITYNKVLKKDYNFNIINKFKNLYKLTTLLIDLTELLNVNTIKDLLLLDNLKSLDLYINNYEMDKNSKIILKRICDINKINLSYK